MRGLASFRSDFLLHQSHRSHLQLSDRALGAGRFPQRELEQWGVVVVADAVRGIGVRELQVDSPCEV